MGQIKWQPQYEIGIKEVDSQHEHLVEVINKVLDANAQNKLNEYFGEAIKELVDYTHYHFNSEESFTKKIGYPNLFEHKAQHKLLIKQLIKILEDLKAGKQEIANKLPSILKKWIIKHVFYHDRLIGLYYKEEKRNL